MNKKITSSKGLKFLRILHFLSVSIWFGGIACIGVLAIICFFNLDKTDFLKFSPLVVGLYPELILPAAVFTIIVGIIYGAFTNWGFFKHNWLRLKWILIILLIPCTGIGGIDQFMSVIEKVKAGDFKGGFSDGWLVLLFIFLQILIILIMFVISVFKPVKKNSESKSL